MRRRLCAIYVTRAACCARTRIIAARAALGAPFPSISSALNARLSPLYVQCGHVLSGPFVVPNRVFDGLQDEQVDSER